MNFTVKQLPSFEDFESIDDFKLKCRICNTEIETGIYSIVKHQNQCIGKNHTTSKEIIQKLINKFGK